MISSVAVFSDIHGMLPALDRVLAEPGVRGAELVVVNGDHTWGLQPTQVLDRLMTLGDRAVLTRGNADRELLQMSRGVDVGLGDDPLSVWGADQLTPAHQRLLDEMPEYFTVDVDGFGPVHFSHATPRSDEEVVLVDSRPERWAEVYEDLPDEAQTVVCVTLICRSCDSLIGVWSSTPAASDSLTGELARIGQSSTTEP